MTTVLIADDEPHLRELVHATVESESRTVVEAADGEQAWALIQELHPALVLLDVRMPKQSGIDVLKAIKSDSDLHATRVILLSAKAQDADIQAGIAAGADHYLTKPFSPAALLRLLEEMLPS